MKYAWIENNRIRDIAPGNPAEFYHADVAKFYDTQVSDDAANGDGWVDGVLVKPEPTPEPAPAPRTWTAEDIRNGLSLSEKVKWDNNSLPEIVTAKKEIISTQTVELVAEVLQMLVDANAISQTSMNKVLA